MPLRITNRTRGKILADRAEEARSFWVRMRGLMGRRELKMGEGLYLVPCNSIHMFFMRFAIDAVFLDRGGRVVKLIPALPPWRATRVYWRAHSVLELPAGVASGAGTQEGDLLSFEQVAGQPLDL
jgi:uncharacterized membrane protein (UPF0127 family)